MKKRILGLDLGTNSVGWALIQSDFANKEGKILGLGSRIIPMSQDILNDFGKGSSITQTAERTRLRGVRRLRERFLMRRERMLRVLNIIDFLPAHFSNQIDFKKQKGQFVGESEPKLQFNNDGHFLFVDEFNKMVEQFKDKHPDLLQDGKKIPYDWTIYYLRTEGLRRKISKEALAWILLQFNQKRGYYQLRGEEEDESANNNKKVEYHSLEVISVTPDEAPNRKGDLWYSILLANGWIYRRSSKISLDDWVGKEKEFIVTTDLLDDGSEKVDKEGNTVRSFRQPKDDDWGLIKKKIETELVESGKTVGSFIFDKILHDPKIKIIGDQITTIDRKYYKDELKAILTEQLKYHPEIKSSDLFEIAINELYPKNESHKKGLSEKGFIHLFVEDILFYQRPLKSQKSSIGNCPLEYRVYNENGEWKRQYLKACSKSHPFYQEFRCIQFLQNLRLYSAKDEEDITQDYLRSTEQFESVLDFLLSRKNVDQKTLLAHFKLKEKNARWNYVENKVYPLNETIYELTRRLESIDGVDPSKIDLIALWHLIYSVTDKVDYKKALSTFATKSNIPESDFVEAFIKFPPFPSDYATYSLKAIKKLLSVMRFGQYWQQADIDAHVLNRINNLINAVEDHSIIERVRERLISYSTVDQFQGLPIWLASYVVYNRHSEMAEFKRWQTLADMDNFINSFKQHSLRNPIVEQVILECLRVVRDIWSKYGNGDENYFDEIHIELARDLKRTTDERSRVSTTNNENELTNLRIKYLIQELSIDPSVENVRPFSPIQIEKLKIFEEGVLEFNADDIPDDISKMLKTPQPSTSALRRYKLWLEQGYRSPYTGEVIPLSKLFTSAFEIEHIIPQSRFFDDSFTNKVICESAVNKIKDNQLGLEFIKNHGGEIVSTGMGQKVKIFNEEAYKEFILRVYSSNKSRGKKSRLLMDEIPDKMVERQKNDTRYISKFMVNVLSNLVRKEQDDDGFNAKNVIATGGRITNELKNDWGLNNIWNDLILPRFERMNEITNSTEFTAYNSNHQKWLPTVPIELSRGFNKKRIDHRHHALDALVVAATSRSHVNYINFKSSTKEDRSEKYDLMRKLKHTEEGINQHTGKKFVIGKSFIKPWPSFTKDAKDSLDSVIVSFKQNLRVINKSTNYTDQWILSEGKKKKIRVRQTRGDNWAIRKSLHKDTVAGLVKLQKTKLVNLSGALENKSAIVNKSLRRYVNSLQQKSYDNKAILNHFKKLEYELDGVNIKRVEVRYWEVDDAGIPLNVASRVSLDTSFNEKKIDSITDSGIQMILKNHLAKYQGLIDDSGKPIKPEEVAFSPEGIQDMNENIQELNNGKQHQPIFKVRTYEIKGNKFPIGYTGNKNMKYVEAAKGTNLFFGIYYDGSGKRSFDTIGFNVVVERLKQGLSPVPEINNKGHKLLFYLSPNDLVYVDSSLPLVSTGLSGKFEKKSSIALKDIYRLVSSTGSRAYFIHHTVSTSIVNKIEFTALNKMEQTVEGEMIKHFCFKLKVDRLGGI